MIMTTAVFAHCSSHGTAWFVLQAVRAEPFGAFLCWAGLSPV